jgi:hypothetical protein
MTEPAVHRVWRVTEPVHAMISASTPLTRRCGVVSATRWPVRR